MIRVMSHPAKAVLVAGLATLLAACSQGPSVSSLTPTLPTPTQFRLGDTFNRGYVISEEALADRKSVV